MTTALATQRHGELAEIWNREKVDLLKQTICKGASDPELELFVHVCKRTGLDPFARQIHAVKRWDTETGKEVMSIQIGIDGFRVVAERTKLYCGQTPIEWCDDKGQWSDVWLGKAPPFAARCGVLRDGFSQPVTATVRYKAYVQTKKGGEPNRMWSKMDAEMLGKCAEAAALRKAFPNDLSGLYLPEEMAGQEPDESAPEGPTRKSFEPENANGHTNGSASAADADIKRFYKAAKENGNSDEEIKKYLAEVWQLDSMKKITPDIIEHCMQWAQAPKQ